VADEIDLRRAVLASPDDDEPRLAYAAFLDGQDSPSATARAQFIQDQIALTHLGDTTPASEEYTLRYRTETADGRFHEAWGDGIQDLARSYRLDRGFVEVVSLTARDFLDRAPALYEGWPIRHLNVTTLGDFARQFFDSSLVRKLRSLSLERLSLEDDTGILLARSSFFEELRWLDLSWNRLSMASAEALAASTRFPNLRYVNFLGNRVELNETYSYDNGYVMDALLPDSGRALEERFGEIAWLHHKARTISDSIPDRFRI
jgi:uncharacterized protein (TIGR02996 family)